MEGTTITPLMWDNVTEFSYTKVAPVYCIIGSLINAAVVNVYFECLYMLF